MKKKAIDSRVESTPPTPHSEEIQRNTSENNRESKRMLMWRYLLKQFVHTGQDISSNEEEDIVRVTRNDLRFDISTIRAATDNFSARNKIADNKYGCLYKGRLSDGQNIAVKSLHAEHLNRSFVNNEIVLYDAKVQHRNIVRLLGFCLKGDDHKRRFLVYEFLPTPLDRLIFGDPLVDGHTCLDWGRRYDIIRGIARGLLYLHEEYHSTIIHRDIKASNILLDENMNPKISGFDLAMFSNDVDETKDVTFAGTMGYMDPDLFTNGTVSTKSDVFSFGVLLLEIVTGQRCGRHWLEDISEGLPSYVRRNYMERTILNVVDPKITDGLDHQIMRCLHIGLLCTEIRRDARPTMRSVVHMLDCYTLSLPDPSPVVNNIDELDGGSSVSSNYLMSSVIESIDHSGGGFVRTESETSITSVDVTD
uniref:Protein kinase domain-containing protein n=2 Tax=Ficus carica TaxID=3494 RepID=A0AA87YSX3_FICCA|nr:hypothetical protein TIFTF001_050106 [Ficus carica]GMN21216.1 hypothetical protein TIFTF001_050108 [Ficus carica]